MSKFICQLNCLSVILDAFGEGRKPAAGVRSASDSYFGRVALTHITREGSGRISKYLKFINDDDVLTMTTKLFTVTINLLEQNVQKMCKNVQT